MEPIRLWQHHSEAEIEIVIRAAYRQVLGNTYVMESERLTVAESQLKRGEGSVREFVRQLAKSDLYRTRFFDNCFRYRAIELNFKHLLGRAPDSFEEMCYHSTVLDQGGFEAEIDSYVDSDEYQSAFGESIVPYYRGDRTQPGQSLLEFTNLAQLLQGASSSDNNPATRNKPQLTQALLRNSPYGKSKSRDASEILAEVFKTSFSPGIPSDSTTVDRSIAELALQQKIQEQAQVIQRLQQQLTDLRPFAGIGATYLKSDWQPAEMTREEVPASPQQQVDDQAAQITHLQAQIADAYRYSAIGEARVNKWRSRVFNG
ncbi:phycobilisome rod-core linker polypeptide [Kovacikia minuta CCNUW1]|uniref:phycobilisome rod-core linker polypeptide n=1 Tax=Kovacikia minuta TaxID=2931930 RepID=UPI001CCB31BC|nr:phycobilisome rod-core linker polypeptide [Kovacikia minuta]UBF25950.1 phycobilisome rod-core linker polypeptide [Kovacikia minuta CCNUW1]